MFIQVNSANMSYKSNELEEVSLSYRANDDNANVRGNFTITSNEYEGNEDISQLEQLAKTHFLNCLDDADYEVRSINLVYADKEVDKVQVVYSAKMGDREFSLTGNLEIDAEEYSDYKTIDQLIGLYKDSLTAKLNE